MVLRRVDHPNVVKVFWADEATDGTWFLVSEYVEGQLLESYVGRNPPMSVEEVALVGDQLLAALEAMHPDEARIVDLKSGELSEAEFRELQELHDTGFVHRDIKPNNIMLTPNGIKVLDFNIASRVGDRMMTRSGTEPYQAPDIGYTTWDVSTDLFAAGVVLYELLCGEHPYPHGWPRLDMNPRDPRELRSDVRDELAAFLLRACAPTRDERFSTAREMRTSLDSAIATSLELRKRQPDERHQALSHRRGRADELAAASAVAIEKALQTLIERNLGALLGVRFLASEYSTGKTHGGRIDTLGIDENGSPVIIEYKRSTNENVINQGLFYLDWLLDHGPSSGCS